MKYAFCYIVILFLTIGAAFAQVDLNGKSYTVEQCVELSAKAESAGNIREATTYLNGAAFYLWELKRYDEGITLFKKSIELNQKINNISGIAGINSNLGMLYFDKGDYDASLAAFQKTLATRQSLKDKTPVVSALINMSVVLNKLKRYNESVNTLEDALLLAGEIEDKEQMLTCYSSLSETYELKGDHKKSMQYFELYRSLQKAVQAEKDVRLEAEVKKTKYEAQLAESDKRTKELELELKDRQLAETLNELGIVGSENKELLEKTSKYELVVKNMEQQEQIKALEQQRLESELTKEKEVRQFVLVGLALALIVIIIVLHAYAQNRKMNKLLVARNEQIITQAKALKEENAVRTKLLSVISHDLRSPLSSVHLMVQLLKTNTFSPEQSVVYLSKLEDSLQNTFSLLDNLLFWAKSQLNGISPKPETFEFSDLVQENAQLMDAGLKSKNISLVSKVKASEVYVDREIAKLVLRNLLSNALKFTPAGGTITVSAEPVGHMLKVAVSDTGVGIPKDQQQNMFTSKMTGTAGTQNEPSSGMGLLLCQDFVVKSGGKIWFESEEGKGTTFFFTLQLSKEA